MGNLSVSRARACRRPHSSTWGRSLHRGRRRTAPAEGEASSVRTAPAREAEFEGTPREPRVIITMEDFREKVHLKVQEVPRGKLCTYGSVAAALGSKKVARQVGSAPAVGRRLLLR